MGFSVSLAVITIVLVMIVVFIDMADEPLICPLCATEFYRWQWTEAEENEPGFRKLYYNHVMNDAGTMYILPCPNCAKTRKAIILGRNRIVHNKDVARWNKLTKAQRKAESETWPMSTAPSGPTDLSDREPWKPEDEEK